MIRYTVMWHFGEANILRGAVWKPLRIRRIAPAAEPVTRAVTPPAAQPQEYDEAGRLVVFRYETAAPQARSIDFDRVFEYLRSHRLPGEGPRRIRRDQRNRADFFADVRELQTSGEPSTSRGSPDSG
jgi:hypothetical protein